MRVSALLAAVTLTATSSCRTIHTTGNLWSRDSDYKDLSSSLSSGAVVYYPNSPQFDEATVRWSNLDKPQPNLVVIPAIESDVVKTVQFANQKSLPFLAYNGAHGAITSLGNMTHGIEINLNKLSSVDIAKDGNTVTIGGGTISHLVLDTLWAAGKQTVTGVCECVSYLGPALGGGHGFLQGFHGLIGDQFVSMNIVLANGTLITVDESSDLWWAIKGAGHNFGVVTSVTSKIFDNDQKNWAIENLKFTGDKVEQIYDTYNKHILKGGAQPTELIVWSYWNNDLSLDPNNPIIEILIIQEGVEAVSTSYTDPFHALGPVNVTTHSGFYPDLPVWVGDTTTDAPCVKDGSANPRFPIYLETYNTTAQKLAYEAFADAVRGDSVFKKSLITFDGYSTEAVKAIPSDSTAFPYRSQNILVGPLVAYKPAGADLDQKAAQLGETLRQIFHEGTRRDYRPVYLNYAYGNEGPKEWYGEEEWRQTKLQALKKKYDPRGMFSFYGPIA